MAPSSRARTSSGKQCGPLSAAPKWLVVGAFLLIAALLCALAYSFAKPQMQMRNERFQQPDAKLIFLYMNGCGWCDKFKPQWDAFVKSYGAPLAASGLTLASYERSDPAAAAFKSTVDGYPTVLLVTGDGSVVKFSGERTPAGLAAFLSANGYSVNEGYEEPHSEFGGIGNIVSATKAMHDGRNGSIKQQSMASVGLKLGS
jgi:thiol-disulfide isomerase/thioredoxin